MANVAALVALMTALGYDPEEYTIAPKNKGGDTRPLEAEAKTDKETKL